MVNKKSTNNVEINDELNRIMFNFDADKVTLYKFYSEGDNPINFRGLDYTHVGCINEVTNDTKSTCGETPKMLIGMFGNLMFNFTKGEIFKCEDVNTEKKIALKKYMQYFGMKSVYSKVLYNEMNMPVGGIVISHHIRPVKIDKFNYINGSSEYLLVNALE